MLKESYLSKTESLRSDLKELDKIIFTLKKEDPEAIKMKEVRKTIQDDINTIIKKYIESNKPCDQNTKVEITLNSGRKVVGEAVQFGVLRDGNVHITTYKQGNHFKYITSPTQNVKTL